MFSISEQISALTKTTLANPLTLVNALSTTVFGGMEKIIALNISTAKQSFESSTTAARTLFSANLPQELFSLPTVKAQPQIEKIVAYGRELAEISAQTGKEFLSALSLSDTLMATNISQKNTQPLISAPVADVEKKSVKTSEAQNNTQLPLLVEAEVNIAKKAAPKNKAKPIVTKPSIVVPPAKIKASKVTPEKTITAAPAAAPAIKAAPKLVETKAVAAQAELVSNAEKTPVAAAPAEKKSAVKMPFPASPLKKSAKPTFPTVSTRPIYKAKGSAATGAKKPVRQ